jgi:hypothetical protein
VAVEELTVTGLVTAVTAIGSGLAAVHLTLTETRGSDGETCVTGTARIEVPVAWTDLEDVATQPEESGEAVI